MEDNGNPRDGYDEEKKDDQALIAEAKAFYQDDLDYEVNVRGEMIIDVKMANNEDHWDAATIRQRSIEKRPTLTVPRFNQFINQIKNEQRQNKPSIKVTPRGAKSAEAQKERETAAKNRQGIIRFIQYGSKASDAYQTAYDFAVECGRGFFRIDQEYVSPDSFDLKIVINRIPDPFNVVMDRSRKEIDYSDCQHAFIINKVKREVFKNDWPDAMPVGWSPGNKQEDVWATENDIWVVEYFSIRSRTRTLLLLDDNETIYEDELKELEDDEREEIESRVERRRDVELPYVMLYKMTAEEILEREELPGTFIPIIPVIGVEKIIVGRVEIKGLMRDLRDSIRSYNYWTSLETELISLAPKAPFIIAAGQIEGYEEIWGTMNTKAHSVAPYKPITSGGRPVPPPQRQPFAGVPTGIHQAKLNVIEDQKAITGMWNASLGQGGQERSGRAILAQQKEGETSNYHFIDNIRIAITHAGVIINQWLPVIYDSERVEKILGEDGDESTINLNGQDDEGNEVNFGSGEFDVVTTMGPSYNSRRQEAAESIMQFIQAVPQFAPLISDLLAKNMDWPGSTEIADRLKRTVPPEVLDDNGGEEQMAQQLQQMSQQLQQDQQMMEQMKQMIEELEVKAEGKELDSDTKIEVAKIKSDSDIAVANIRAETDVYNNRNKIKSDFIKSFSPSGANQ